MDPTIALLIGTLIGAVVGTFGTIFVAVLTNRSQERRQLRELALNAALANWERAYEEAKRRADAGTASLVWSLDEYLVHSILLIQLLTNRRLTKDNIADNLREAYDTLASVNKEMAEYYKNKS
jgi:gas vesicle protein